MEKNNYKAKKKTVEEKERLRQYNRNYYNNVRKNNLEYMEKMRLYNEIHNTKRKETNENFKKLNIEKKIKIIKDLNVSIFNVKIEYGEFILEF